MTTRNIEIGARIPFMFDRAFKKAAWGKVILIHGGSIVVVLEGFADGASVWVLNESDVMSDDDFMEFEAITLRESIKEDVRKFSDVDRLRKIASILRGDPL